MNFWLQMILGAFAGVTFLIGCFQLILMLVFSYQGVPPTSVAALLLFGAYVVLYFLPQSLHPLKQVFTGITLSVFMIVIVNYHFTHVQFIGAWAGSVAALFTAAVCLWFTVTWRPEWRVYQIFFVSFISALFLFTIFLFM
ncbi:hypothetical protein [Salsuginibacillus halophilus]|uniref:hypothetical protein n=1 Tax=Salsuginibacillus halophilus TaxID=517424 RepID=UPI000D0DB05E|nr:hypothetical protein [Salsuginibacillus halophilus]